MLISYILSTGGLIAGWGVKISLKLNAAQKPQFNAVMML